MIRSYYNRPVSNKISKRVANRSDTLQEPCKDPIKLLYLEIINRAKADALISDAEIDKYKKPATRKELALNKLAAREWISDFSEDFIITCISIGIDPELARSNLLTQIEQFDDEAAFKEAGTIN